MAKKFTENKPIKTNKLTNNKPIRKTPKKIKKVEANYDNGKPICTCGSCAFSSIRDYDISPDDKKYIGKYKFIVDCLTCGNKVTYYINM